MDLQQRAAMRGVAPVQRAKHAQSIGMFSDIREQFTDAQSALSMLMKSPGTLEQIPLRCEYHPRQFKRRWLAIVALQQWFWVKRIDVRWATLHE
jgi:hypothetical protein